MEESNGPAYCLEGQVLEDGWIVAERLPISPDGTGGNFSVGYALLRNGKDRAFLKALDFSRVFGRPDAMQVIESLVRNYNFEQELSYHCRDQKMTRVIRPLGHGTLHIPGFEYPDVYYIIYEMADGDSRRALSLLDQGAATWKLQTLHDVAAGLRQLHSTGIAHQDLKPSNVMCFEAARSKVGDLGQASRKDRPRPLDDDPLPGDPSYAPPEQAYRQPPADWVRRRYGCDVYHLGSLALFFFTGVSMTHALDDRLDPAHLPGVWGGDYQMVLPFVVDAWDEIMREAEHVLADGLPSTGRDIAGMIRQLTHPDPELRGHPKQLGSVNPYSLDRYVAHLDLLARRAAIERL